MLKQMISEEEAVVKVRETMLGLQGDRWMVSFWRVVEGKEQNTLSFAGRVSWRFPVGDYEKCIEMLKENMDAEVKASKPPVPAPLDVADWLKPKKDGMEEEANSSQEDKVEVDEIDELFNPPRGE